VTDEPPRDGRPPRSVGRGARHDPANRFTGRHVEADPDAHEPDDVRPETRVHVDASRSVLARNRSPDVGFDVGLNPYRGCEHGCVYCYARPTHEYLGLSAGLDFERRIFVKRDAPALLREALAAPSWTAETIALSGVTDPYQPLERRERVTRACLEVLAEHRQPVSLITKNHLVTRDLDLLQQLARFDAVAVTLSITTLDDDLRASMEPRTSSPARRLAAVRALAEAGVPVGVNVAPVVPGLTDPEIPAILEAAAKAGASFAGTIVMRLPHAVEDVFTSWLETREPARARRILARIREVRGGRMNDPGFGSRMRGEGGYAEQIRGLYDLAVRRHGLDRRPELSSASFRVPGRVEQPGLFAG
jgi:DNA repair photolyase